MADSLAPKPTLLDDESLAISGLQLRAIASELALAIDRDDAFDRIDELDRLVNDLLERYADLRVAMRHRCPPRRNPLN